MLSGKALLTLLFVSFLRTASIILLGKNANAVKMVILEMPLRVPVGYVLALIQTGNVKCREKPNGGEGRENKPKPNIAFFNKLDIPILTSCWNTKACCWSPGGSPDTCTVAIYQTSSNIFIVNTIERKSFPLLSISRSILLFSEMQNVSYLQSHI